MFLGPVGDDPQSTEVKRLAIRPGDVIVIKLDHFLDDQEFDTLASNFRHVFDGEDYIPKVLILEPGAEIGVIGPEDGT